MRNLILMLTLSALVLSVPPAVAGGTNNMSLQLKWKAVQEQQERIRQHLNAIEAEAVRLDESDPWSRTVKPKTGK